MTSQHKVKVMFTAPTAFRAIKKEDPTGALIKNYDLSNFKALFWRASDAIRIRCIGLKNVFRFQ